MSCRAHVSAPRGRVSRTRTAAAAPEQVRARGTAATGHPQQHAPFSAMATVLAQLLYCSSNTTQAWSRARRCTAVWGKRHASVPRTDRKLIWEPNKYAKINRPGALLPAQHCTHRGGRGRIHSVEGWIAGAVSYGAGHRWTTACTGAFRFRGVATCDRLSSARALSLAVALYSMGAA